MVFINTAQSQHPIIISEDLQEFAVEHNLPDYLGLSDDPIDIARYINMLSSIEITARERAISQGYEKPTSDDFLLAAAAWCNFPLPFKPPEIKKFQYTSDYAYTSISKREIIANAVGPSLRSLTFEEISEKEPISFDDFMSQYIDFYKLE